VNQQRVDYIAGFCIII